MAKQEASIGGRRKSNTSEESILKDDGTMKTTETTVDSEQMHVEPLGHEEHLVPSKVSNRLSRPEILNGANKSRR
jgi:hypothetical protein